MTEPTPTNTKTQQILQAYASGEPRTYRQVAAQTGIGVAFVQNVGVRLQRRKYLQRAGESEGCRLLRITPAGARHAKRDGYMVRECRTIVEPDAETTVQRAIALQPALARAWGGR